MLIILSRECKPNMIAKTKLSFSEVMIVLHSDSTIFTQFTSLKMESSVSVIKNHSAITFQMELSQNSQERQINHSLLSTKLALFLILLSA